jgi:hypothetical protein
MMPGSAAGAPSVTHRRHARAAAPSAYGVPVRRARARLSGARLPLAARPRPHCPAITMIKSLIQVTLNNSESTESVRVTVALTGIPGPVPGRVANPSTPTMAPKWPRRRRRRRQRRQLT